MKCNNLEEVRVNIDRIDREMVQLIAERQSFVMEAAHFKKDTVSVADEKRVEAVITKVRNYALEFGANPDLIEKLYREMISGFIALEMKAFKGRG